MCHLWELFAWLRAAFFCNQALDAFYLTILMWPPNFFFSISNGFLHCFPYNVDSLKNYIKCRRSILTAQSLYFHIDRVKKHLFSHNFFKRQKTPPHQISNKNYRYTLSTILWQVYYNYSYRLWMRMIT